MFLALILGILYGEELGRTLQPKTVEW